VYLWLQSIHRYDPQIAPDSVIGMTRQDLEETKLALFQRCVKLGIIHSELLMMPLVAGFPFVPRPLPITRILISIRSFLVNVAKLVATLDSVLHDITRTIASYVRTQPHPDLEKVDTARKAHERFGKRPRR
jgi:hypothetical protein